MRVIDFHNHYYPPAYIDALRDRPGAVRVEKDGDGNPVLISPGDKNFAVPGHRDLDYRLTVLDAAGIDTQVITFTAPGTVIETPERSVELARLVNDALADARDRYGSRYRPLATLPLNDPDASVREYRRVREELGLPGVMVYGNVGGVALHDERYRGLWEAASADEGVVYIHPTYPLGVEAMEDYWLMPLCGFLFDTTLAAAGLVFSGVVERHPGIRWALGHLGGTIPYLAERLDRGYDAFADCRRNIPRHPTDYLRNFYYDTVNFDPAALKLAIDFAGVDRILAGSDYPHRIGSLEKMKSSIASLGLSPAEEARVFGGNAAELLGID